VLWALGLLVVTTFVNAIGLNPLKYVVNVGIVAECIASVLIGVLLLLFFRNHPISFLWDNLGAAASFGSHSYFAAFLAAIAIERAHVAGVSLGAAVGIHLAARHPDRVRSLSLHSGWHASDDYLKIVVEQWRTLASTLPTVADVVIQAIFPWCFTPEMYIERPEFVDMLVDFVRGRPAQPLDAFRAQTDAVIAHDAITGVFAAISAENAGWSMTESGVQWSCATCWVQTLADVCRDACRGMITDCQALPCIPWSNLPAAQTLEGVRARYLPNEPKDVLTYGPIAITLGLGLWIGMTGPNLTRTGLIRTVGNLRNWDAGIGPILNTSSSDHFGGKAIWMIKFTGRAFDDYTRGFVTLSDVKIPESLTTS
jgi:pimeloyl-ACP methyl ester carboxylesterase